MTEPEGNWESDSAAARGRSARPEATHAAGPGTRRARWTVRRAIELLDAAIDASGDRLVRATDPPEWSDVPQEPVGERARRPYVRPTRPQIPPVGDEPDVTPAPSLD